MARRWGSTRSRFFPAVQGTTLESIVLDAIQGMRRDGLYTRAQARILFHRGVNGLQPEI